MLLWTMVTAVCCFDIVSSSEEWESWPVTRPTVAVSSVQDEIITKMGLVSFFLHLVNIFFLHSGTQKAANVDSFGDGRDGSSGAIKLDDS